MNQTIYKAKVAAQVAWADYNSFIDCQSDPEMIDWDEANLLKTTATEADELVELLIRQEHCHHEWVRCDTGSIRLVGGEVVDDIVEIEVCTKCHKEVEL
jgi:hypothetical protein